MTWASGARRRVGYASYRYARLHNHAAPSSSELWRQEKTHSAEQQLALLGWTGIPVSDRPATRLPISSKASARVAERLHHAGIQAGEPFALIHPAAAFDTKTWSAENFARVAEHLARQNLRTLAVVAPNETPVSEALIKHSRGLVQAFNDLSLPEVTAMLARARLFVGNDSGIAHIASAVGTPSVVVFGSSNVAHWRPWTRSPAEVVREEMPCAPCPGYACAEFGAPECIRRVPVGRVVDSIERVLVKSAATAN